MAIRTIRLTKNVILHVVCRNDLTVKTPNEVPIPVLLLMDYIDPAIVEKYARLHSDLIGIPCNRLHPEKVSPQVWNIWKERLNIERLQNRVAWVEQEIEISAQDWEKIFYKQLFISMGTNVNKEAFALLADRLDFKIFGRLSDSPDLLHAYVFGMSGMLDQDMDDPYFNCLKSEFKFLRTKYNLHSIPRVVWKYSRMHPQNFPDIRIAQVAELIRANPHLFSTIMECSTTKQLKKIAFRQRFTGVLEFPLQVGRQGRRPEKSHGRLDEKSDYYQLYHPRNVYLWEISE